MPEQLDIMQAIARSQAEEGMRRSLEHAEAELDNWGDIAFEFLKAYARSHESFAGWMVVRKSENDGHFPTSPNAKAWGAVIHRAARLKIIERVGTTKDPHRHGNPIPLWRSLIYGLPA